MQLHGQATECVSLVGNKQWPLAAMRLLVSLKNQSEQFLEDWGHELKDVHLRALGRQTKETLADWWCILNRYEWPPELVHDETFRWQIMAWIAREITLKACLRAWNADWEDDEFEAFWRRTGQSFSDPKEMLWK